MVSELAAPRHIRASLPVRRRSPERFQSCSDIELPNSLGRRQRRPQQAGSGVWHRRTIQLSGFGLSDRGLNGRHQHWTKTPETSFENSYYSHVLLFRLVRLLTSMALQHKLAEAGSIKRTANGGLKFA